MAAKLQNSPGPAFSISAPSAQAHTRRNPFQAVLLPQPSRVHVPPQSSSSQPSNPFRIPNQSQEISSSRQAAFSPVSPIERSDLEGRLGQQTRAQPKVNKPKPDASKMSSESRKSVDLLKLDGKPYPGRDEAEEKPRKVKVAQDMYAGELPPGYEQQGYKSSLAAEKGHKGDCRKCGGHQTTASDANSAAVNSEQGQAHTVAQNIDCRSCGGKKSMPPSSFPRASVAHSQPRSQSQPVPRASPAQSSEAGPSGHRYSCGKCGRRKRPDSISTTGSSQQARSPQAGISVIPAIQTTGIPTFGMNVEPPTAINERAPTLPYSPALADGKTPLIKHDEGKQKGHKPSRSGSISSLFRSFSRRNKASVNAGRPLSQQVASRGEQNSNIMTGKTSHAIGDHHDSEDRRLRPGDYIERPGSPFSFVDKTQEEQAFEMEDMRKSKQPERRNSWDKADESTNFLSDVSDSDRPRYSRSQSARTSVNTARPPNDVFLALPPDQRPGITRFKSLRTGYNRASDGLSRSASQIGRSTSLRRLGSVKKVPQLFYREDGAEGADYNYVY